MNIPARSYISRTAFEALKGQEIGVSDWFTVTQAQLVDVLPHLREDREALAAAAVVCEAAAGLTPEHEPDERVFALAEARTAPGLANDRAYRPENVRNRLAA